MVGKMLHIGKNGKNVAYLGGAAKPGKFYNFSPVKLGNDISALKLTKKLFKYEHFFFMKTANLIKKWVSPLSSTNILCLLTKYKTNGTSKIPMPKLVSDLGKIWKCNLGLY